VQRRPSLTRNRSREFVSSEGPEDFAFAKPGAGRPEVERVALAREHALVLVLLVDVVLAGDIRMGWRRRHTAGGRREWVE
jgi:hypothetical protein